MEENEFYEQVYGRNTETYQVTLEEQFQNLCEIVWKLYEKISEREGER